MKYTIWDKKSSLPNNVFISNEQKENCTFILFENDDGSFFSFECCNTIVSTYGLNALTPELIAQEYIIKINPISPQNLFNSKFIELSSIRDNEIYGTFIYKGNLFDCDKEARANIDDLVFAQQHDSTFTEIQWNTHNGANMVMLSADDVIPFKTAAVQVKNAAWGKFTILVQQLQAIDLESENAIELINQIIW